VDHDRRLLDQGESVFDAVGKDDAGSGEQGA
jgi:hypothetical protein